VNALVVAAVVAGGGAAAVVRYFVSRALPVRPGRLPIGVLIVNVAGALLGGIILGLAERAVLSTDLRLVLLTGVCGGLTTFSTWSVETIELALKGRWRSAVLNLVGTLLLGIAACAAGYLLAR